jgi:DNA-binding HxlR family transcriptional regulator
MNKIGGKWKPIIIYCLANGKNRFSVIQKTIPTISKQMLVNQLRELEADKLVDRKVFAEVPPKVEYTLSEYGETVLPIIMIMADWGKVDFKKSE